MSQNEKRLFDRHKKQEELPLEQTQAVPAVQDEITAEPAAEATPKRNKYADKMNRKKRRLSKGARIGITAAAVALLLGGGIRVVVKSRCGYGGRDADHGYGQLRRSGDLHRGKRRYCCKKT
ncbi:MAG: hypothetical protein ACLT2F_11145 [Butyricicoccus sp.]